MNKKEIGLYIHIPFCKHKCDYCDFISFANKEEYDEEYQKFIKYTFNYSPMTKFFLINCELSLLDLFKSEIIAHKVAGDKKLLAKLILDEDVPEVQRRYIQKLISLANEFSKDEKVLRLKSLTSSKALS